MEEYLNKIEEFYNEKTLLFIKNNVKCGNDCHKNKLIKETEDELILSCGETTKTKCGIQFKIKLPKYIYYYKELSKLKYELTNTLNWDILINYLEDYNKDYELYTKKKDEINKKIFELNEQFKKVNEKNIITKIEELYNNRLLLKRDCDNIMKQLKSNLTDSDEIYKLRTNYLKNIKIMNDEYLGNNDNKTVGILQYIDSFKQIIIISEPSITIINDTYINNDSKIVDKSDEKLNIDDSDLEIIYYNNQDKKYKWLSTFNKANPFVYKGITYPTVEHAYQAQKILPDESGNNTYSILFSDFSEYLEPSVAKSLGSKQYFSEKGLVLRKDWDNIKLDLMYDITNEYYKTNHDLIDKLINTDDSLLIHCGPNVNEYWGVINKDKNNGRGEGENNHGIILMKIRKELYEIHKYYNLISDEKIKKDKVDKEVKEVKKDKVDKEVKKIKIDKEVKSNKLTIDDLLKLDLPIKVSWVSRNKKQYGTIKKIDKRSKKNIKLQKNDGSEPKVEIAKLTIEK